MQRMERIFPLEFHLLTIFYRFQSKMTPMNMRFLPALSWMMKRCNWQNEIAWSKLESSSVCMVCMAH